MTGHDGCGCGHGHAETMQVPATGTETELPVTAETTEMEGCGEGCGCGTGTEATQDSCGEGCGCGHASPFGEMESATLQGFLTGLYASTMDRPTLAAYFEAMGNEEGSPFAKPAQMLADALEAVPVDGEKPAHVRLLEVVSGENVTNA